MTIARNRATCLSHHHGWYFKSATRKVLSSPLTKWNIPYLLDCWIVSSYVDGLHLWLMGAIIYSSSIWIETVENCWSVFWIYRDFRSKIQSFGWFCVVRYLVRIKIMTLVVVTGYWHQYWYDIDKTGTWQLQQHAAHTLARSHHAVNTLVRRQRSSLPSKPIS